MTIVLREIRTAVQAYLDNVAVSIAPLVPAGGASIQPNEEFTFSVTVQNTVANAIDLKNVRYFLKVDNPQLAQLKVPLVPFGGAYSSLGKGTQLTTGSWVSEMYIFPLDSWVAAGATDVISGLVGKGGPGAAGGTTSIRFKIFAEPDLSFLFPPSEDSPTALRTVQVIG